MSPSLLNPATGEEITVNDTKGEIRILCPFTFFSSPGVLAFKEPWPGLARSIYGDHSRFVETYFKPYKGYYFTGDGAYRDHEGHYWIYGRVDGTMESKSLFSFSFLFLLSFFFFFRLLPSANA
jgi:acetyl-CoA synthetase